MMTCPVSQKSTIRRRRIEIKKIEKDDYRKTTWTKRRQGLFKKANKLCEIEPRARVAIITFSPGGKALVSGHPSVDSVVDHILACRSNLNCGEYSNDHDETSRKKVHVSLEQASPSPSASASASSSSSEQEGCWWELSIEDMDLDLNELKRYKASLEVLKKNVAARLQDVKMRESRTTDFLRLFDAR